MFSTPRFSQWLDKFLHKKIGVGFQHIPYNWEYASAGTRTSATGFKAEDIGKFARQLDDNSIWMLTAIAPTWVAVGAAGGGGLTVITTDTTYTVKVSGGDFTTIQAALDSLKDKIIVAGKYVTIEIDDGVWNITSSILVPSHAQGAQIRITGKTLNTYSITSIASSSGSSGNYTFVLNMPSTTGAAVGDYLLIFSPSGGTAPAQLCGCWPITAINPGVSVSINTTHNYGTLPSGAVTSSLVYICKTVINLGANAIYGLTLDNAALDYLDKLTIIGTNTAGQIGAHCSNNSTIRNSINAAAADCVLGLYKCPTGLNVLRNSSIQLGKVAIGACSSTGAIAGQTASLVLKRAAIAVCASYGAMAYANGFLSILGANNTTDGSVITCCQNGITLYGGGTLQGAFIRAYYSTGNGVWCPRVGTFELNTADLSYNGNWGINAATLSGGYSVSGSYTGNALGATTPTINTEGNGNSYISST